MNLKGDVLNDKDDMLELIFNRNIWILVVNLCSWVFYIIKYILFDFELLVI